jgi:MFS family permease
VADETARGAWSTVLSRVVIVGALGYFVDIYDLLLFSIVRRPSLIALGVPTTRLLAVGADLLNWQMLGLLLGGILWGVLGDKRGRRSVLFGSIALYSIANIANAFAQTVPQYAALRFFAGLGLAGELGAAVTLVSEALPARLRGYGTMVVSAVGILGAAAGYVVARGLDWRIAYITGGVLGLVLLVARIAVAESGMFKDLARQAGRRGSLLLFVGSFGAGGFRPFTGNGDRLRRLGKVFLVGVPLWCAIGIVITFSPEIASSMHVAGAVDAGKAVLVSYIGASAGSLVSGALSQALRSRRLAILAFVDVTAVVAGGFLLLGHSSLTLFYAMCGLLGIGVGYWAVFVQTAAEQFGTDLRATVATAAPNLVRGAVLPLTFAFRALAPHIGLLPAAVTLLGVTLTLALVATWRLPETFGRDLDFTESSPATVAEQSRAPTAAARSLRDGLAP